MAVLEAHCGARHLQCNTCRITTIASHPTEFAIARCCSCNAGHFTGLASRPMLLLLLAVRVPLTVLLALVSESVRYCRAHVVVCHRDLPSMHTGAV